MCCFSLYFLHYNGLRDYEKGQNNNLMKSKGRNVLSGLSDIFFARVDYLVILLRHVFN
jgi:hypothetical protein